MKTILIVDDDPAIRRDIGEILLGEGYQVKSFADGKQAWEYLRWDAHCDAILLDLNLPVMDGWQFRLLQRRDPRLAAIPVIAISGERSAKAEAVDAYAFLDKPVRRESLLRTLADTLQTVERESARTARIAQAERMASLGLLAAGIAHEINNPLTYLLANLDQVIQQLSNSACPEDDQCHNRTPVSEEQIELLREARDGAGRICNVIKDLRVLSRERSTTYDAIDVRDSIEASIRITRNEIRHRARLVKRFEQTPPVWASESRLTQVLVNLLVNAAQAIVEGFADSNEIRIVAKTDAFGRALIEVSDTGQGMSTDSLKNSFVPFHTTKAKSGTGLGLTISKSIVNDLGGEMEVQSELGKGTCFRVVLPPAETRPPIGVCGDSTAPSSEGKRGKVLVIDDELSIVQAFARALETGHDVTGCTLAEEALGLIGAGNRYDVIFCDLLMPQMTGMDFYAKLEGVFPQEAKKVIFLTGGVFTARASSFMEQVPNRLVHKPVDALGIQALVRCLVA